jgi:penicillin amidase
MTNALQTATPQERKVGKRILWTVRILVLFLVVAAIAAGGAFLWVRHAALAALPQLDGTITLQGLHAQVSVTRDIHGVPTIAASSMDDLFFAQGFVTAQDRLWQMDSSRRFAAGELAAALGPDLVKTDISQRVLGLRLVARNAVSQLSARDRGYLEAYARGVNAYIAEHRDSLPLEFRVARYFPNAWTPEDTMLVGALMAENLTHGPVFDELNREKILQRLGPELTADLYLNSSFRDLPPMETSNPGEIPVPPKFPEPEGALVMPSFPINSGEPTAERLSPGSNNWVVSGAHTASGKPLLSNDMHLDLRIPGTWYEAHLIAQDFDVTGVTLPGVPAVIVGHNRRIAWGFTSVMPTVQDVYIENFNQQGEYQTPSDWRKPEVRHETIHVNKGQDIEIDVVVTRHGPIITPILKGETRQIALRWMLYDSGALGLSILDVNRASNWQEFRQAFSRFNIPGQNVVYADVDGHIGYQATGLYPIRAAGDGSLPVSGADDAHEWIGYVPFEQLPSIYDPPTGIIVTANGRITPTDFPNTLSSQWGGPYRTERIHRLLRGREKLTAADMLKVQTDVTSQLDRLAAERMVYSVDHTHNASPLAKQAADLLRPWDGTMSADSAPAAIERATRAQLEHMLLESKLGPDWKLYRWFMSPVWMENMLSTQPARWLPTGYADWNAFLTDALERALKEKHAPQDLAKWNYGEAYQFEIEHPVFSGIPVLKKYAGPGAQPMSGDGVTVKQVGRAFGPSERFTADLSNWDASTLNIVNGQSGNLLSPNFNDQWKAWYEGTTFPLPFTQDATAQGTSHRLALNPR